MTLGEARTLEAVFEPGTCPWRGLLSYEIEDAAWFAGREHLVAALVSRLATTRLLAVVGPSGSGKSSALRAGMLAALTRDALPGSSTWRQVVMRPGRHPMRELARASLGGQNGDLGDLLASLIRTEDRRTHDTRGRPDGGGVDACGDQGEREAPRHAGQLLGDPLSSTSVVLALRADYVAAAAEHAELATLMADSTLLVGSPTPTEIERDHPARGARWPRARGRAGRDVGRRSGNEPGLLPLLSVALTQVWQQRTDERLTYAGYVGVGGASSTRA